MYWKYFTYIIRHKWFVFLAGLRLRVNLIQLITHDWSKFSPAEFIAYAQYFNGEKNVITKSNFDYAWNHHQKINPHHWQYWVLINDSSEPKVTPLIMPPKYVKEMIADWAGAGKAITGKWEVYDWYHNNNKDKIILHPVTRAYAEMLLEFIRKGK